MNVKNLSNALLLSRMGKLVKTERKITHLVLECIAEIDARKIYLEKAYSSLYDFLINEYGYSPSAAYRRIESARLLREVPELSEQIESGALNLSQISKAQSVFRAAQKIEERKILPNEKREVLRKMEFMTHEKTEIFLAKEYELPVDLHEKTKCNADESVTITMTLTKAQIKLLREARDLVSHACDTSSWSNTITYLAERQIAKRKGVRTSTSESENKSTLETAFQRASNPGKHAGSVNANRRNGISLTIKKALIGRSRGCEFKNKITGQICGSKKYLQIDHVQPVWAGGSDTVDNLRTLCGGHNRYRYKQGK